MLVVEAEVKEEGHRISKESLEILPSKKTEFTKVYLSKSKSSWITIEWLSKELIDYATKNYQTLFAIHPIQKGKVVLYDQEFESPRWHRSYLHQPKREQGKTSYMYSGIEPYEELALPLPFQPFLDFLNATEETNKYNQVIVNWYANGNDYIKPHSDCQIGMATNVSIVIITLCEDETKPRELILKSKNLKNEMNDNLYSSVKIKLEHACIVTMHGDTQTKFRHGVSKALDNHTSRISLTFRKFLQ